MTADTHELRLLAVDLSRAPEGVERKASAAVRKTLYDIQATSQKLVPRDTGNLANSIGTDVDGDGLGGVVGPTADYGRYVEEGTQGPYPIPNAFGWGITVMHPGNSAQPYMGPAFDKHEPRLARLLTDIGGQIL